MARANTLGGVVGNTPLYQYSEYTRKVVDCGVWSSTSMSVLSDRVYTTKHEACLHVGKWEEAFVYFLEENEALTPFLEHADLREVAATTNWCGVVASFFSWADTSQGLTYWVSLDDKWKQLLDNFNYFGETSNENVN